MTTTKAPTALGKSILSAIKLSGVTEKSVNDRLGISHNTFDRRLASDTFTVHDIVRISEVTGFHVADILPQEMTRKAMAA